MTTRGLARMFTPRKSALLAASAVVLISAGPAVAGSYTPGSSGAGDPYFPLAGNGGYDVSHYSLSLGYEPASKQLTGTAVITATATQNLSRFDLDLRGFTISKVQVNGSPAAYERAGDQELVITPSSGLRVGRSFTVSIAYAGVPQVVTDPDDSIEGWVPTADGAFVVGEPQGAPGWFPANDNPQDKATFDMAITVPDGLTALGNGALAGRFSHGGRTTWVWHEGDPMATYLATATNGRFTLTQTRVGGIPVYNAVDPTLSAELGPLHEGFAEWSEWIWSERHGGPTAQDFFDEFVAENDPGTWDPAPGLITDAADLFGNSVYDRG